MERRHRSLRPLSQKTPRHSSAEAKLENIREFRGVWCRSELFDLVESSIISGEQAWLLLTIDSLVKPKKNQGCWASNEWLGTKIGKHPRHVRLMIKILMGWRKRKNKWIHRKWRQLIRQVGWKTINGQRLRVLDTRWTRIMPDGSLPEVQRYKKRGVKNNPPEEGRGVIFNPSRGVKNNPQVIPTVLEGLGKKGTPPTSRGVPSPASRDGHPPDNSLLDGPECCRRWERDLVRIWNQNNWGYEKHKPANGIAAFARLLKTPGWDEARIGRQLTRYGENFGKVAKPEVRGVHQFCRITVFTFLEDQLDRIEGIRRVKRTRNESVERRLANGRVEVSSRPVEVWEEIRVNGRHG